MNAFTEAFFSVTSSIFHSREALQGVIVSSMLLLLLTSTLPHISHICLLYSLKAISLFVSGLDKYSTASLWKELEACDAANVMYLYNISFG